MRKMGFRATWLDLIEGLVFNSSMSILIIGSPSKDFKVN